MPHVVDQLIEERAERLRDRPLLWHSLKPLIYPLLGYRGAIEMADTIAPLTGLDVLRHLSDTLRLDVRCTGLDHVPRRGLAVITPNHPSGIADGIAVFDALREIREDVSFFANRDAIRVCPGLADVIVPVEWVEARRDHARGRETVRHLVGAFRSERLIVIFPSGRLARPTLRGLVERVDAGELSFPHLRGRTWLPPAAQAAEASTARSDLRLQSVEEHDGAAVVRFAATHGSATNGSTTVRVRRTSEPVRVLKSCGDPEATQVWPLLAE